MRTMGYDYQPGGAYGICARCGFQCRLNTLAVEWSGARVCPECYDPRPETMSPPRVVPEGLPRPDMAPEPPDEFVDTENPVRPEDL